MHEHVATAVATLKSTHGINLTLRKETKVSDDTLGSTLSNDKNRSNHA